nr:Chain P, Formin-1 [synthetic construct]
GPPLIPPPP